MGDSGYDTRIDLVLSCFDVRNLMLVECKRVNPAYGHWVFAASSRIRRAFKPQYVVELPTYSEKAGSFSCRAVEANYVPAAPHVNFGIQVRTGQSGDNSGKPSREAIEDAAGQVCRGMNGLVNYLRLNPSVMLGRASQDAVEPQGERKVQIRPLSSYLSYCYCTPSQFRFRAFRAR
jgi:hypothetical protein